jgi:hypothetical protein
MTQTSHRSRFISIAVLALGVSITSTAQAASVYAGKYTLVSMDTSGPVQNRQAKYGTLTVSSAGDVTAVMTKEVSGNPTDNPPGQTKTVSGAKVSASGVVTFPNSTEINIFKFVKSGTTVIGIQGTYKPGPGDTEDTTSGIYLGLRQP